ncbi:MAG: hypothetical protein NTY51_11940 [Deltaproteobacteria bacterium]|nr:hypothetical protein [Deltaproteobacteria bacterium]
MITAASGGYLYYDSAQKSTFKETEKEFVERSNDLRNGIIGLISANQNIVAVMAQVERIQRALLNQDQATFSRADKILDDLAKAFAGDIFYLMDRSGKVIASSNRNDQDSFVGHDYSFRPYSVDAIKGRPGTYLGVGATSDLRGIYFSHPVYSTDGGKPTGTVVIKKSTRDLLFSVDSLESGT